MLSVIFWHTALPFCHLFLPFEAFIGDLKIGGRWGDGTSIRATANLFNSTIHVWQTEHLEGPSTLYPDPAPQTQAQRGAIPNHFNLAYFTDLHYDCAL